MPSIEWGADLASVYDATTEPAEPAMVDRLVDLAGDGAVLEFAVGTGRVALELARRGVHVRGIELSEPMIAELRAKPDGHLVPTVIGDMTSTRVDGEFGLVVLVFNTIMNVTTQDEQVAVFENAAAHLGPGGRFVVEVVVPQLRRVVPGEPGRVFAMDDDHVGIETFDDPVGQVSWSHHWYRVGDRMVNHSAPYRYVWPSELDLMARVAGFELEERSADWSGAPFTSTSDRHVSLYALPAR